MDSAGAVSVIFHFQNVSLIVTRLQDNLIASQESRGSQTPVQLCSPSFNKILPIHKYKIIKIVRDGLDIGCCDLECRVSHDLTHAQPK